MLQCNIGIIYQTTEPTHLATMGGLQGQHRQQWIFSSRVQVTICFCICSKNPELVDTVFNSLGCLKSWVNKADLDFFLLLLIYEQIVKMQIFAGVLIGGNCYSKVQKHKM
jgi:hypothetical protein